MKRVSAMAGLLLTAMLASNAAAAVDQQAVDQGQAAFQKICATCHANQPGRTKIGPSLFGVVGRKAGSLEGFHYSDAMKSAGITWDDETLDKHLSNPRNFIPGNRMTYTGVKDAELRRDIILYLGTLH